MEDDFKRDEIKDGSVVCIYCESTDIVKVTRESDGYTAFDCLSCYRSFYNYGD